MNIKDGRFEILVVEDNAGDLELITEAWEDCGPASNITVATHGEEAMDILFRRRSHSDAPVPDLILLDWNLPRKNGKEVLTEIKADEQLRSIPVVVLTTSDQERDIVEAYNLHANCYVTKPMGLEAFLGVIKSIGQFWLTTAKLPKAREQEVQQ